MKDKKCNTGQQKWRCSDCGYINADEAKYCANCGCEKTFEMEEKPKKRYGAKVLSVIMIIILIIIALLIFSVKKGWIDIEEIAENKEFKKNYKAGVEYMEKAKYEDALNEFEKIESSWDDYEKVEKKIEEVRGLSAFEHMKKLIEEQEYESAIQSYRGNAKYLKLVDGAKELYMKCVHDYIMKQVSENKAEKDYASIIILIQEYMNDVAKDSEIMTEFTDAEQKYRTEIVEQAKKIYEEEGASEAVIKINEGLGVLETDETLLKEKEKYQGAEPIALSTLEPFTYGRYELKEVTEVTDIQGTIYEFALYGKSFYEYDNESECSNTYDINKEYDILRGTVAIGNSDKGEDGTGNIKIYGDGTLLYEKKGISSDMKAFPIEVKVTEVIDLKIEMYSGDGYSSVNPMLCDVTLQKSIK